MSVYIDEQQLHKRFLELANRSYNQNIYTFTDFLGMSEQSVFWKNSSKYDFSGYQLFGGFDNSERIIIRFGNADRLGYEEDWNITCILIEPLLMKFAENLSHRDFLGALMNLGIDRSKLGDIKVSDKSAYLFCENSIAEYICDNLDKVRHTNVKCLIVNNDDINKVFVDKIEEKIIQIASLRADAVVSKAYNLSRNDALDLFREGKVFVNGRICENNSKQLKYNDAVTVRGFGKFVVSDDCRETRKGKISIGINMFI